MLEDEATASTDGRGRKVGSFGERMALVMHKWTWQQLLAQKGPKCQGGASEAGEAVEAVEAKHEDEKRSEKVHYADSSQIH